MNDERCDVNPEVEEDAEAHFEEMMENDAEFRRLWEESRPRRELGLRVLRRRIELGLSQKALAEKIGTSQNRIYLIETGEANPTLDTLERLASALGVSFEIHPSEKAAG
ncbi:MAG: helix-turn-helix domain-containing protein [Rubrobacteraceae bacterium]